MASPGGDRTDARPLSSVSAPATVLLLAPAMSSGQDACPTVGRADRLASNLLVVLLNGSLEPRLDVWRRHDGLPEDVCVVCCEETRATASAVRPVSRTVVTTADGEEIPTQTISSPDNLTDLGLVVDRYLESRTTDGVRVDVCFDSLTTLLHYVDVRRAFRFLHSLGPRLSSADGLAHFHMDPNAHDEKEVAIVRSLFDTTYRYDEASDEWRAV